MKRLVVLAIAGYDPSGGAGITADQRVIESFGCTAVTAITAITVQSSTGVRSVHPVEATLLRSQLTELIEDCRPDAVKIGMLGSDKQALVVVETLRRYGLANVVLDPVLASTGEVSLLDETGREILVEEIVPLCRLVTPNLAEAYRLTGIVAADPKTMAQAGMALVALGASEALVKGGHLDADPVDVLVRGDGLVAMIKGKRVVTPHTHGTGCFLSSAIAAGLAKGRGSEQAVRDGRAALVAALNAPVVIGKGRGYPGVYTL